MRHADLGVRIFLFGNLVRRPPAVASPSPPPCRLVDRLETEAPSEPRSMPCPRPRVARVGCVCWPLTVGSRRTVRDAQRFRVSSEE